MTSGNVVGSAPTQARVPEYSKGYRWNIIMLLAVSQMLAYADRINLSVAAPVLIRDYHFTPAMVGLLLSIFSWTYTFTLLLSGPFVDWVRARISYPISVGLWSLGTALCGITMSFTGLSIFRGIVGVGEAPMIPLAVGLLKMRCYR